MSSYSSTSLSSFDPTSSSSDLYSESSPSTSPSTSPPSPFALKHAPSFPPGPRDRRSQVHASATPPSQRTRTLTRDARPHGIGVDPGSLIGKQLTRVRRSRTHPCITLNLSDGTTFQVLVVGYDPHFRGVPKVLESDSPILNPRAASGVADLRLTISHAASITLSDKAFQVQPGPGSGSGKDERTDKEDRWTQRHAAFALKFEEEQGWHCVWATMAEYDEKDRERCVFRNYADVYLDRLQAHPAPHAHAHANGAGTPKSAPAHATTFARAASPSSPSLSGAASGSHRAPGAHKGKRRNHRKKKAGPGHGSGNLPNSGTPKARW